MCVEQAAHGARQTFEDSLREAVHIYHAPVLSPETFDIEQDLDDLHRSFELTDPMHSNFDAMQLNMDLSPDSFANSQSTDIVDSPDTFNSPLNRRRSSSEWDTSYRAGLFGDKRQKRRRLSQDIWSGQEENEGWIQSAEKMLTGMSSQISRSLQQLRAREYSSLQQYNAPKIPLTDVHAVESNECFLLRLLDIFLSCTVHSIKTLFISVILSCIQC